MWSSGFRSKLAQRRITPYWIVEVVRGTSLPFGGSLALSSFVSPGYTPAITYVSERRGGISPGDWSYQVGQAEVGILNRIDVRRLTARGQLVEIRLGFDPLDLSSFEPVFAGHVQSLDRTDTGDWRLTLRDVVASLTQRQTLASDDVLLFSTIPVATEINAGAGYTAGAASMTVDSTTGFLRETGGDYLIRVTPTTGDPFLLTASGITATTITGLSASGVLGTTAVDADDNDAIECLALVEAHPVDAALRLITSTGTGTNGPDDTLPQSWGMGIPHGLVDRASSQLWRARAKPATGSVLWMVHSDQAQTDALGWLQGVLAGGGFFACQAEGRIQIRAVMSAEDHPGGTERITDDDVISVSYQTWDSSRPVEYSRVIITGSSTQTTTAARTLESMPGRRYNTELFAPHLDANEAAWETEILDRLGSWLTGLPETVEIRCSGLRLAHLGPGDWVAVDLDHWEPRDLTPGGPLDGGEMLVLAAVVEWQTGEVALTLACPAVAP